ncbi:MAG: hypothetical protein ACJAT4_002797 [Granulosicoccus sp.]|jgi:hypothetical protein
MKKIFQNRLDSIDWIAKYAKNEGQFEVLREQLNFNYIYNFKYFVVINEDTKTSEVIIIKKPRR